MAARRLLIVMLVLLGISTIAAALVPQRPGGGDGDGDTETAATDATTGAATEPGDAASPGSEPAAGPAAEPAPGAQVVARIFVGGKRIPVVPVALGDRLRLTVCSREVTDLLEVPRLGRFDPISPGTAVLFDFLPAATGSYAIRFLERDALAARIQVEEEPRKPAAPAEPESAPPSECPAPAPR